MRGEPTLRSPHEKHCKTRPEKIPLKSLTNPNPSTEGEGVNLLSTNIDQLIVRLTGDDLASMTGGPETPGEDQTQSRSDPITIGNDRKQLEAPAHDTGPETPEHDSGRADHPWPQLAPGDLTLTRFLINQWRRIGARLYLALGFAVLLTLLSSGVGVYYFERSGDLSFRLRFQSMPALHAAWSADLEGQRLKTLGLSLLSDLPLNETVSGQESVAQILRHLEAQLAVASALPVLAPTAQQAQTEAYEIARTVDDIVLSRQAWSGRRTPGPTTCWPVSQGQSHFFQPAVPRPLDSVLSAPDQPAVDRVGSTVFHRRAAGPWPNWPAVTRALSPCASNNWPSNPVIQVAGRRTAPVQPGVRGNPLPTHRLLSSRESALALESTVGSFEGRVLLAVISLASVIAAMIPGSMAVGRKWHGSAGSPGSPSECRMRRMADGDLEMPVPEVGQDEIGELAHALEVLAAAGAGGPAAEPGRTDLR